MQRFSDYGAPLWRFFNGAWAIWIWNAAFSDPTTRLFKIAQSEASASVFWFIGSIGVIIILDVFINDFLPDSFDFGTKTFKLRWEKAFEQRHWLFGILALGYVVHPYVMSDAGRAVEAESFFYLVAAQTLAAAFVDVKIRARGTQWQRACG